MCCPPALTGWGGRRGRRQHPDDHPRRPRIAAGDFLPEIGNGARPARRPGVNAPLQQRVGLRGLQLGHFHVVLKTQNLTPNDQTLTAMNDSA
jgi:hypothetical protein